MIKLNNYLKKCSKHGKLFRDDVIKAGKLDNGDHIWRCKHCMKEIRARHYQLNKKNIRLKQDKYRSENREYVREISRKSCLKKRKEEFIKSKERWENYKKSNPVLIAKNEKIEHEIDKRELKDSYVRWCLVKRSGLKITDIPDELVQAKRAIMLLKRSVKRKIEKNKLLEIKERNENAKNK